jgi:hypothetical protein
MYLKGGNDDTVHALLGGGLQVNVPEDASHAALRTALGKIADVVDRELPVSPAAKSVGAVSKFNTAIDRFTFGTLQTGFKIIVGSDAYERLLKKGMPSEQAARIASSYANDIFGSLDWFRVAQDVTSRMGRDVAYGFFNPNGRRWMQIMMFAPDWTFSTFRAAYKALPGAVDDPALSALHRRYLVKSALYYLTIANGINMLTAGHWIFSNENPTRIQLGDGRTMQFSKHFMEPFEWLRDPTQTAENKLGFYPRELFEQLGDTDYLSAHQAAPAMVPPAPAGESLPAAMARNIGARGEHIAKSFAPIPAQQGLAGGGALSVTGLAGMPIYGKDPEQKSDARKRQKLEKQDKKRRAAEYYRRLNQ